MSTPVYNIEELLPVFAACIENLNEISANAEKGSVNFVEVAKITGAQNLIKDADSQLGEGVPVLKKAGDDMIELLEKATEVYKKRNELLNNA